MKPFVDFFNHPFFIIVGGLTTLFSIGVILYTLYLVVKGILPVWYRLGIGLSKRQIALFAEGEYDSLKGLLVDSGIFQDKNIIKIDNKSIKKAEKITLLLVHWKPFEVEIDHILKIKKDNAGLIIYAPQDEGLIDKDALKKINAERNAVIVNFRGRLLNDILVSMITTTYDKK